MESAASARPTAGQADLAWDASIAGWRVLTMRVLGRTFYRRLSWMELSLDPSRPVIEAQLPLDCGFLGEADAGEIAVLCPDVESSDSRARFARGDRCFGARYDGRLVAISWVATGAARVDYLGLAVVLPAGAAYIYGLWTEPRLRGMTIAPSMTSRLRRVLAGEGYDTVCAGVLTENRAAMYHMGRAGYRQAGVIGWVGLGPMRRFFRRPPRHGW